MTDAAPTCKRKVDRFCNSDCASDGDELCDSVPKKSRGSGSPEDAARSSATCHLATDFPTAVREGDAGARAVAVTDGASAIVGTGIVAGDGHTRLLTVRVAPAEREASSLSPQTVEHAAQVFLEHGVVVLEGILDVALEVCHATTLARLEECRVRLQDLGVDMHTEGFSFHELVHRSRGRFDMQFGLLDDATFFVKEIGIEDSAPWVPIVQRVLSADARLLFSGAVVSLPGSEGQPLHMDGCHLFGRGPGSPQCPPHCLTVFVPLVDITNLNGPPEFWPGSHWLPAEGEVCFDPDVLPRGFKPELSVGTAVLFDYRIIHRGTPNLSTGPRPMFYSIWGRAWFREAKNFPTHSLFQENAAEFLQ